MINESEGCFFGSQGVTYGGFKSGVDILSRV